MTRSTVKCKLQLLTLHDCKHNYYTYENYQVHQEQTSNVASICSHKAVSSDNPLLRTSTAGTPTKQKQILIIHKVFYCVQRYLV